MERSKKHEEIKKNYQKVKSKHLENLATKILKQDEVAQKLKNKPISGKFLDLI